MNQSKLRQKTEEIFERQDFDIEIVGEKLKAVKQNEELELGVYSSKKYDIGDVIAKVSEDEKVFVDEGLSEVENRVKNDVSIIKKRVEERDFELPSYEIIGDIAVINELTVDEDEAVEGILHYHPSVKTILLKEDHLKGEFRVGEYRKLYGNETETVHKEFDTEFKVDPTQVFFSEREGTERKRLLDSVSDGDKILVMFAGIGPIPILLADNKDVQVVGVEKNPKAVDYAKENVKRNNVESSVQIIEADVADIIPELNQVFDKIVMPSPTNSTEYLDEALMHTKDNTEIILYALTPKDGSVKDLIDEIDGKVTNKGFEFNLVDKRKVSDYSPSQKKFALTFEPN